MQDYDEKYPGRGNTGGAAAPSWRQVTQPYIKSTQVFACPSNTNNSTNADTATTDGRYPAIPRSYGISAWIGGTGGGAGGISEASVDATATKIMVGEIFGENYTEYGSPAWSPNDGNWAQGFAGHLSTANYLFADGHVKSLRPTATASPLNMWGATNSTAPTGCTAGSINCDTPDPSVSSGMAALYNKYR